MTSNGRKLLWVEDDLVSIGPYKQALLIKGWQCTIVKTLTEGFEALKRANADWDFVLIDLHIPVGGTQIPPELAALGVLDARSDVLGRLLGLWLWEQAGWRCRDKGPKHAYFTVVPDRYRPFGARQSPEFLDASGQVLRVPYVLSKWERDLDLPSRLEDLNKRWAQDFPRVCAQGAMP